ncbi:MAG: Arm DNA-binding domain-containing protein, partial [Thiomonas sp.]
MSTLTDAQARAAQPKAGKLTCLFDGGGLYLEITKAGSKGWRFKYRYGGVE